MNYQTACQKEKVKITRWIKQDEPELAQLIRDLKQMDAEVIEITKPGEPLTCL